MRLFISLLLITILMVGACSKNNSADESMLYGTWVKGTQAGDTLWFMKKDGKNMMRANLSFNPTLPTYNEMEYNFKDGKLSRVLPGSSSAFSGIDSFTWTQTGRQFEILGYQLYMFMSSTTTKFAYTKVN